MRIGITMLSHDSSWGGPGIYTKEIVRSLLDIDDRNEYVLIYPRFGLTDRNLGQYSAEHGNVTEVATAWTPSLGTLWEQLAVPRVARRRAIDVLFNPFWSVPFFANYKTVMIVHNTEFHTIPNVYDWRRQLEWTLHQRVWIHRADAVISISNVITEDLVKYVQLPREKIRLIYHGCHERFRHIEDPSALAGARKKYRLPEKFLLYVGMIFPQKNFINLARAFHLIREKIPHELVVIGKPRWKYARELELLDELEIRGRVRFIEYVPNEELPEIYNLADCFIYPSLYEAFGLAGVEALACGCPVAAARAAAIPEVLGDAALLFDPHDPEDIARCIMTLLEDERIRADCVRKGLERARFFTWKRAAAETLRLLEDVVGTASRSERGYRGSRP
jgi:glycosyltransferase involved in cell wall biosynthesis